MAERNDVIVLANGGRVEVRPAKAADASGWIDLLKHVSGEGRYLALENVNLEHRRLARYFKHESWSSSAASIVAVSDKKVVGQLTMYREKGVWSHVAELGMSVAADFRRMGVGTALIASAKKWARDFDVEKISLNVFPHNASAIALYEKNGFVQEGLRKRQAKLTYGYEDLVEMSLWIGT